MKHFLPEGQEVGGDAKGVVGDAFHRGGRKAPQPPRPLHVFQATGHDQEIQHRRRRRARTRLPRRWRGALLWKAHPFEAFLRDKASDTAPQGTKAAFQTTRARTEGPTERAPRRLYKWGLKRMSSRSPSSRQIDFSLGPPQKLCKRRRRSNATVRRHGESEKCEGCRVTATALVDAVPHNPSKHVDMMK